MSTKKKSRYPDSRLFVTNPGCDEKQLYAPKVTKTGSIELVPSGKENIFAYIQSFRDSTDINIILTRVAHGEVDLLRQRPGSYGDFTKLPQTFAEMLQLQIDSNRLFEALPVDVKQKFNNSSTEFFAQSGSEAWYKKIESVLPEEVKSVIWPAPVDVVPSPAEKEVSE